MTGIIIQCVDPYLSGVLTTGIHCIYERNGGPIYLSAPESKRQNAGQFPDLFMVFVKHIQKSVHRIEGNFIYCCVIVTKLWRVVII